MRILFIGTVQFSKDALLKLIELKANVVGVITKDKSSFNSDFADLKSICDVKKIDCICVDKINDPKVLDFSQAKRPDIIFCFGWSALLAESFLTLAPMGVVG
jgi:methionyl-tRNA formyltransferase